MEKIRQFICWFVTGHRLAHTYKDGETVRKWCVSCGKNFGYS